MRGSWLSSKAWDRDFLPFEDGGFEVGLFIRHELAGLAYGRILPSAAHDALFEYFNFRDDPVEPVVEIAYVWVFPDFRGRGLSQKLVEALITVGIHWGAEWASADVYSQVIYQNIHAALGDPRQARAGRIVANRKKPGKELLQFEPRVTYTYEMSKSWLDEHLDRLPELTDRKWHSPIRQYGYQLRNKRMAKMIWKVPS